MWGFHHRKGSVSDGAVEDGTEQPNVSPQDVADVGDDSSGLGVLSPDPDVPDPGLEQKDPESSDAPGVDVTEEQADAGGVDTKVGDVAGGGGDSAGHVSAACPAEDDGSVDSATLSGVDREPCMGDGAGGESVTVDDSGPVDTGRGDFVSPVDPAVSGGDRMPRVPVVNPFAPDTSVGAAGGPDTDDVAPDGDVADDDEDGPFLRATRGITVDDGTDGGGGGEEPQADQADGVKRTSRRWWIIPIVALSLVATAVGVYAGVGLARHFGTSLVPSAVAATGDTSGDDALCHPFTAAKLGCTVSWQDSEQVDRGQVLSQSVDAGQRVRIRTAVQLVYSNGPSSGVMPQVVDQTLDDAKTQMYKVGVSISSITEVVGNGVPRGHVVSASVQGGAKVSNGQQVSVQVSNGQTVIPNWVGKSKDYVDAEAATLGLTVQYTDEQSSQPSGIVLGQTPSAGVSVTTNVVKVSISQAFASTQIAVPDVIGKSAKDAQSALASAGFRNIQTVNVSTPSVKTEQVTQVVPGVGQQASSDNNVVIIVSQPSS